MKHFILFFIAGLMFPGNIVQGQIVTVFQTGNPVVYPNTINNPILKIEIVITAATTISDPVFNTNSSSNPVIDIMNAKLFYSGNDTVFDAITAQHLGTFINPWLTNFSLVISPVNLGIGFHYFWVTYDILPGAIVCDLVDAELVSFVFNGMPFYAPFPGPAGYSVIDNCTSVIEAESTFSNIAISPNPATDIAIVKVNLINEGHLNIQLFDIFGRPLSNCYDGRPGIGAFELHLPMTEFASGIYSLQLTIGSSVRTIKLIKQ